MSSKISTATNKNNKSKANVFTALFATAVYVYLLAALISWWLFLAHNDYLPAVVVGMKLYSMELAPKASSLGHAAFCNISPMFLFGFFHSLLARKTVKKWMDLPTSIERSTFCLQAAIFLHMIQHAWLDMEGWNVWDASSLPDDGVTSKMLLATFWFGVAFLFSATFALDHFHLFGLSQGFGIDINRTLGLAPSEAPSELKEGGLATRWHYRLVAHPVMTGMFLTFWATPVMSPGRLVCAAFLSFYILIAVLCFEERTIRDELGSDYDKYLAKTPRFFPSPLSYLTLPNHSEKKLA
jgi:protein-S-isoprenylcysteine O-methyltransferase Ste14